MEPADRKRPPGNRAEMPARRVWSWREGPVDRAGDHFELRFGSVHAGGWDDWLPVALVGPPVEGVFAVQFLVSHAEERNASVLGEVRRELDYYLVNKREPDPWKYARYHGSTAANMYSKVHWSFFAPLSPTRRGSSGNRQSS
jgi:hypothetical protein